MSSTSFDRKALQQLELDINIKLNGMLLGNYQGILPGVGQELGEARPYQPGDDVRNIDWNVTARLGKTHIRQTIADNELATYLVVDLSARANFGTQFQTKKQLALTAAAIFGHLTVNAQGKVGAILVDGLGTQIVAPRRGLNQLQQILNKVQTHHVADGTGPSNLAPALRAAHASLKQRGLIVVISDYLVTPHWENELRKASMYHQCISTQIRDRADYQLADIGLVTVVDPATGQVREADTSSAKTRSAFAEAAAGRQKDLDRSLGSLGVPNLKLETGGDWIKEVVLFAQRNRATAKDSGGITT